jgi:diguanylate cyclase (GGDEF)-like protein
MDDAEKTRDELVQDVKSLRARVAELERALSERKQSASQLLYEATHDSLTGLLNRTQFLERLAPAVQSARRYASPLSVCLCSLDGIRAINQTQGRHVADELLAEFGDLVRDELRGDDVAGRYGEDEFCIAFPHTAAVNAGKAIERIQARLRALVGELPIMAAYGIADLVRPDMSERDLVALADQALRDARAAGGDRIVISAP